ncbi:MAG: type II secretion system protein [bacterium]|nr:type II secretion system protein [bacterium]
MKKGFTLIEMLVTIGITIMMAGVLLAYNRSSERQLALSVSQARLVGVLTRAKAHTLEKFAGANGGANACAFGVHFAPGPPLSVVLFQNLPANADEGCYGPDGTPTYGRTYADGEGVETVEFDRRIIIIDSTPLDLVFDGPYLSVYVDGSPASVQVTYNLETVEGGDALSVTVGPGGEITAR